MLSSETLLHILLSSEYSGFRPSTTAVVTQPVHTYKWIAIESEGIIYIFLLECVVRYLSIVQYVCTGFWVTSFHTNMRLIIK